MAKKEQIHYYVLVFTNYGAKYVTGTQGRTAYWDGKEAPEEMSKAWAYDIVRGLTLNGYLAQVVVSQWEIETQPYRYTHGEFKWNFFDEEENS